MGKGGIPKDAIKTGDFNKEILKIYLWKIFLTLKY